MKAGVYRMKGETMRLQDVDEHTRKARQVGEKPEV
jgi:hypothetical protein